MLRTALPPTPASSTEIKGQDGTHRLATPQMALELPPPALHAGGIMSAPDDAFKTPFLQASETVKSRRRASAAQRPAEDHFALPPPPVRSRKIIQMKPREDDACGPAPAAMVMTAAGGDSSDKTTTGHTTVATKRKQPSATSAAGRKVARKTAHSLIERRRRSKINDEFSVLKAMIPACTGEMHKLAILQASIEYIRYLQDCVDQLKAQRPDLAAGPSRDDGESDDVDMGGSQAPSRRQSTSLSSEPRRHHHYSYSATTSTLTSPALLPQRDVDREVTAALLMLNRTDRRGPVAAPVGRGMSVRDLLTS